MHDLDCVNLTKRFGGFTAVEDVSFQVTAGSFFSILGPSGSGKTTLMRMIAGFEEPTSGDIRIKGSSVVRVPPNRRNVKMVFQHLALFPMMNVGENIAYGLRCRGAGKTEIRQRIADVLDRVGLPGAADKEINQLSGGQKQRIAIARCMVLEPDVLLLDEPLGALDLKLRERMKIELKLLQHQFATTFLYITHDQSEALVMSDRVAVMNAGKFEQVGTPQELYLEPRTAFVAGFVGDSNRWPGRVTSVAGDCVEIAIASGETLVGIRGGGAAMGTGDAVEVFVRPASIALAETDARGPDENLILGTVDSLLFNGADSRALVRCGDRQIIEVALPQMRSGPPPGAGEMVRLVWTRRQTSCFPARS